MTAPQWMALALVIVTMFLWNDVKEYLMIRSIENMGHMKRWWIFGFEWWGVMRPAEMRTPDGKRYVPLFLGLWIKKGESK